MVVVVVMVTVVGRFAPISRLEGSKVDPPVSRAVRIQQLQAYTIESASNSNTTLGKLCGGPRMSWPLWRGATQEMVDTNAGAGSGAGAGAGAGGLGADLRKLAGPVVVVDFQQMMRGQASVWGGGSHLGTCK